VEAVALGGLPALLIEREAGVGNKLQRVLFRAVDSEVVIATLTRVDELEIDVVPDAFDVAVMPDFKGIGRGGTTALVHGTRVGSAAGVGLDLVGLTIGDVDVAAIRQIPGFAGSEMLIRI